MTMQANALIYVNENKKTTKNQKNEESYCPKW